MRGMVFHKRKRRRNICSYMKFIPQRWIGSIIVADIFVTSGPDTAGRFVEAWRTPLPGNPAFPVPGDHTGSEIRPHERPHEKPGCR